MTPDTKLGEVGVIKYLATLQGCRTPQNQKTIRNQVRNKQEFLAAPGCWQLHCGEPASGPPASALCSVHTSAIQHQRMFQKHLATARYKLQCPPRTHFPALIQKHNGVTKAKIFLSVFSHHHSEHRINVSGLFHVRMSGFKNCCFEFHFVSH